MVDSVDRWSIESGFFSSKRYQHSVWNVADVEDRPEDQSLSSASCIAGTVLSSASCSTVFREPGNFSRCRSRPANHAPQSSPPSPVLVHPLIIPWRSPLIPLRRSECRIRKRPESARVASNGALGRINACRPTNSQKGLRATLAEPSVRVGRPTRNGILTKTIV